MFLCVLRDLRVKNARRIRSFQAEAKNGYWELRGYSFFPGDSPLEPGVSRGTPLGFPTPKGSYVIAPGITRGIAVIPSLHPNPAPQRGATSPDREIRFGANIQYPGIASRRFSLWIPASAGMTAGRSAPGRHSGERAAFIRNPELSFPAFRSPL